MKADWDDAPDYLKAEKPSEMGKWIVAGSIGVAITACVLFIGGESLPAYDSQAVPEQSSTTEPEYEPRYTQFEPTNRSAEENFWKDVQAKKDAARQTDFNDRNYAPREPQNVVDMSGVRESSSYRQKSSQSSSSRQVEYDSHWIEKWSGGARYLAKWTIINNRIDGGTVCANHKRGSIDYRECRKGSKQFFKEECRAWESRYDSNSSSGNAKMKDRYCIAASNFNPMG